MTSICPRPTMMKNEAKVAETMRVVTEFEETRLMMMYTTRAPT